MLKKHSTLTQSRLKELLHYDPETGIFTWVASPKARSKTGDSAGSITPLGYVRVGLLREQHMGHRLAWLYMFGVWPEGDVDHINGIRHDNRLANIRQATRAENAQNLKCARSDNKSGLLGVSWRKGEEKWIAQICIKRKWRNLGLFDDPNEAHQAYSQAKRELHPFSTI